MTKRYEMNYFQLYIIGEKKTLLKPVNALYGIINLVCFIDDVKLQILLLGRIKQQISLLSYVVTGDNEHHNIINII